MLSLKTMLVLFHSKDVDMEYKEKIKKGFALDTIATDYLLRHWLTNYDKITDIELQHTKGDIIDTVTNTAFDFKFDTYQNDNIVIEVRQMNGKSWVSELDDETYIMWIKCATGIAACCKVKHIKAFTNTALYKHRKQIKTFTNALFKNFTIDECRNNIESFHVTNLNKYAFWKDRPSIMKQTKISTIELYQNE